MPLDASHIRSETEAAALVDAMVQVAFSLMTHLTQLGAANDLSLTQLRVLAILRDREPRMAELATHLGLDRSTVSGLVDRGERRGLVVRVPDSEDKRSNRVQLTEAGHELAGRLTNEMAAFVQVMTSGLAARQRRTLRELLERALSGMTQADPDESS